MTELSKALQSLGESRARYGDLELQLAEAHAVIEKVREHSSGSANIGQPAPHDGFEEGLDHGAAIEAEATLRILATARSVVLEDRDREVAARTLEEFCREANQAFVDEQAGIGHARVRVEMLLFERAAAIRKGDTNA